MTTHEYPTEPTFPLPLSPGPRAIIERMETGHVPELRSVLSTESFVGPLE